MKRGFWLIIAMVTIAMVTISMATLSVHAQRTATTTLLVQVRPEAHLTPEHITLHFRLSADGLSDVTTQTETISAWVRALPGQRIRLTASSSSGLALGWSGAVARATGGGRSAACTSGTFTSGTFTSGTFTSGTFTGGNFAAATPRDLVAGWTQSGILACAVTFTLADAGSLAPGLYSETVDLALRPE